MILTEAKIETVFTLVKQSIESGLTGVPLVIDEFYRHELSQSAATFVSLHRFGELRGCIGTLDAYRTLAEDVAANAYGAAFRDPRFPPLVERELEGLAVEYSILTPSEPIEDCQSQQALMDALVPFKDGVIISDGVRRATFLPAVWAQLPDKKDFVKHLMHKASIGVWSSQIRCERYSVNAFEKMWQDI